MAAKRRASEVIAPVEEEAPELERHRALGLCCPLTRRVMRHPVTYGDGFTYEVQSHRCLSFLRIFVWFPEITLYCHPSIAPYCIKMALSCRCNCFCALINY
jgi:hypothetical protein